MLFAQAHVPAASMKALPKKKGNGAGQSRRDSSARPLNESPYEKEGKFVTVASAEFVDGHRLNESPSEKEGKSERQAPSPKTSTGLNESPSQKEGK